MYRLNPLMRNVLIMTDEVIFHATTKQTLDPRTILQSIIIAEERFIKPTLGDDLYDDICNTKNVIITDANKGTMQTKLTDVGISDYQLKNGDIVNAWENLSVVYQTLWKQLLWKLCAECVMLLALPENFVQFGSEGVVHTSPTSNPMITSGAVTPDLKSVRWTMDKKLMDRIDPLIYPLHKYLCKNKTNYPKYIKDCSDCNEVTKSRKTDFILGLYDDEDNGRCCSGFNPNLDA